MYGYGIVMGLDIIELSKLINTPQGRMITRLCEGDVFNNQLGAFGALKAIQKLEGRNLWSDLHQFDVIGRTEETTRKVRVKLESGKTKSCRTASDVFEVLVGQWYQDWCDKTKTSFRQGRYAAMQKVQKSCPMNVMNTSKDFTKRLFQIAVAGRMKDCMIYVEQHLDVPVDSVTRKPVKSMALPNSLNSLINKRDWEASFYQLKDWCNEYGNMISTYYSQDGYYAKNLKILAQGGEEMRILGRMLSCNKGIQTRMEDALAFREYIENAFINRVGAINMFEDVDPKQNPPARIDFTRFCVDENYRRECINAYDEIKHSVNILAVVDKMPHILSYLKAYCIPHTTYEHTSLKYRTRNQFFDEVCDTLGLNSKIDKDNAVKGIEAAVNYRLLTEWLSQEQLKFVLPKGKTKFVGRNADPIITTEDEVIPLWNENGLATFKYFMENDIIPTLQSNSNYSFNSFVQGLKPFELTKTGTHAAINAYKLEGNMIPNTDSEESQLQNYLADFNSMYDFRFPGSTREGINTIPSYADAFYIYSQYVFGGKKGRNSLMTLFDNGECGLANRFTAFEAQMDANGNYSDFDTNVLLRWCAPNDNYYHPSAEVFYGNMPSEFGRTLLQQVSTYDDEGHFTGKVVKRLGDQPTTVGRQNYVNPILEVQQEIVDTYDDKTHPNIRSYAMQTVVKLDNDTQEEALLQQDSSTGKWSFMQFTNYGTMPLGEEATRVLNTLNKNIDSIFITTLDSETGEMIQTINEDQLQANIEQAINNC